MLSLHFTKRLILTCLIVLEVMYSCAQINNFKKWSVRDGLIQSDIYDVMQDSRGYMWIASGGGVSVFDGIKFKHFTKSQGLAGNLVRCVFEDSRGWIWFGTNEGLCYNDGKTFHKVEHPGFKGSTVLSVAEDKMKNILAGTDDGGLNVVSFEGDSLHIQNFNEQNGLSSNSVFDISVDKEDVVWLATFGGGLNIIQQKNGSYNFKIVKGIDKLPSDQLVTLEILGDDIWLGSYDAGAFLFSKEKIKESDFGAPLVFNISNGLNSNCIWNIMIARDKKIWLASLEKGLHRLEKRSGGYDIESFTNKVGLSDNQILSIYEDTQQNVWIGTNGNGLNMLRGDYFSHYSTSDGLLSNKVQAINQDEEGVYWLAQSGGGLSQVQFQNKLPIVTNYLDKSGLTDFISSIAIGRANNTNIWLGTDDHGIVKFKDSKFTNYTEKDGLVNNRVYSILVDSRGIVWSGTADGISRYDGLKFLNISTDKMKMANEGVKTIIEGSSNSIWFGTSGGVARYKGEGDLRTFDEVEGLKAKDVNALAAHVNGDIYIGTNTGGLYKYDHLKNDTNAIGFVAGDSVLLSNSIRSLKFLDERTLIAGTFKGFDKIIFDRNFKIVKVKHYGLNDGFIGMECNDNALFLDKEKILWFGTVNGLTSYDPSLDNKVSPRPEVFITDLLDVNWQEKKLDKQKWFDLPITLTLPYYENRLSFKFHSNNQANPQNVLYKIKLEGSDKNWSASRRNTEVTFSGLAPGSYTFMVMAQHETGDWSAPAQFAFKITPPWYKTKTFYVLLAISIILLVYAYIKWRERKLIKEKEVLENTVKERTIEVEEQKKHVEEKNREITDSINYAKGIQSAMLPPMSDIFKGWKDLFIFFQPKDIVSGDFYWFHQINEDEFLIACADCTGHGVPGGFMSMVCSGELHDAAKETTEPAEILRKTNNGVKIALRQQTDVEGKNKDGMEICLLKVNTATSQVSYSGANRILWVVDGATQELLEIKPDKASIASFTEFDFKYKQTDLKLKKGDLLYTTSDGYPDQFGGSDEKKYMSKNLKNLLLKIRELPMHEQSNILKEDIKAWMSNCEQVDDILVIGIRL